MSIAQCAARRPPSRLALAAMLALAATPARGAEPAVHRLRSERQAGETLVRVLVPDGREEGKRYPVLYVLPVEPGVDRRFGDALEEVVRHDLHNKHRAICVFPTFSQLPWYADNPADPKVRQESYLLRDVLPLVERAYPARTDREGRLLVGFSKSGWGAYSLLLRHPDVFGKAAAWDAPLAEAAPVRFGMGPIFGAQTNFENYRITSLLARRANALGPEPRLVLLGYGNFREAHVAAHRQMTALGIPHVYRDGPSRKHDWHSGWLAEAVAALMAAP